MLRNAFILAAATVALAACQSPNVITSLNCQRPDRPHATGCISTDNDGPRHDNAPKTDDKK